MLSTPHSGNSVGSFTSEKNQINESALRQSHGFSSLSEIIRYVNLQQRRDLFLSYFRISSAAPALDQPGIETGPTAQKSKTQPITANQSSVSIVRTALTKLSTKHCFQA